MQYSHSAFISTYSENNVQGCDEALETSKQCWGDTDTADHHGDDSFTALQLDNQFNDTTEVSISDMKIQ